MEQTNKGYFDQLTKLLQEIYQEIRHEALVDKSQLCWETITSIPDKNAVERGVKYGLSNGTTGIALFLIEYYKSFPSDDVENFIKRALDGAFDHYNKDSVREVGFYNGRGGLIYTLVQAHKILKQQEFLLLAGRLIRWPLGESEHTVFNLNSGISGYLLGILHYYHATNDGSVLGVITTLIEVLVSGAKIKKQGIFWDELFFSSGPLCSFIYGNPGIVFVLSGLQKRFNIAGLDKIIEEAIAFDASFYCEKAANWPDHSNENIDIDALKMRTGGTTIGRKKSTNTFSWSIGSPGTLLALDNHAGRNNCFKKTYEASLRYLRHNCSESSDFTLHNGLGGILLSCLAIDPEFYFSLDPLLAQKKKFGYLICGYRNNRSEFDLSLFRGDAGIGYMILKMLFDKDRGDSVLFPVVPHESKRIFTLNIDNLIALPLRNISSHLDFGSRNIFLEKKTYFDIATMITAGDAAENDFNDVLRREKFKMFQKDIDFFREFLKLNSLPRNIKMPRQIQLDRTCKVVEFGENRVLLVRRIGTVEVHELNEMQYIILSLCDVEKGIRVQDVITRILKAADVSEAEVELLENSTLQELAFWFQFGVLVKP